MCLLIRYPLRYAGVICTLITLLVLAPLFYFAGGCIGTYVLLFSDEDTQNTTTSIDRAMRIITAAYEARGAPAEFHKWGLGVLITYLVVAAIIFIVLCARTTHACGRELQKMSESEAETPMQSLRSEYEARHETIL